MKKYTYLAILIGAFTLPGYAQSSSVIKSNTSSQKENKSGANSYDDRSTDLKIVN